MQTLEPTKTFLGYDPHHVLGLQQLSNGNKVIRLWRPEASDIYLEVNGKTVTANKIENSGFFEYEVPPNTTPKDYRIFHHSGLLAQDPYSFSPTFGEIDAHLLGRGVHYELYNVLGAHLCTHEGVEGIKFAVWAPAAKSVSLVGDFNLWDGRVNPMRSMGKSGVWELFVPGLPIGQKYKYEILTKEGHVRIKSDPFAFNSEMRPHTASIVCPVDGYEWNDKAWIEKRGKLDAPMAIYEVHLGSWRKKDGQFINYRDIAHQLADYCIEMGFTHIELLPISEHPLDESWGYQVTGFFGITSRFGTPQDFQYFVDHMHSRNIGVFLDWVPAHFPIDDFSLARFDGTSLYEHEDPRKGFHPHWNTYIFNYGRNEVANFLIASALYLFDKMHIDGMRVDAVASLLYLDYGRNPGEWIPNIYGGKENLEAIEFLKHLNSIVHERFPNVLMCAEESTSFLGVTHPLSQGGLGFDLKWNMGWMNDTLRFFHKDPLFRHHHQNDITFSLIYAFSEKFILVLSHDEVVHGKASLLSKMPGDDWQKFANVRLLYCYMMCHPGKKLLFMGGEIGQWNEWSSKEELSWYLLQYKPHQGLQRMVKELNHLYQKYPALWEKDFEHTGFEWIDFSDGVNSVISFLRKSSKGYLACVLNFTPNYYRDYQVKLPNISKIQEVFNSDREEYGGSGKITPQVTFDPKEGFTIQLAPLGSMIFEVFFGK